jgi:hypothetical protein
MDLMESDIMDKFMEIMEDLENGEYDFIAALVANIMPMMSMFMPGMGGGYPGIGDSYPGFEMPDFDFGNLPDYNDIDWDNFDYASMF